MEAKKIALDTDTILVHFDLRRLRQGDLIDKWTSATGSLNEYEMQRVEKLYQKALKSGDRLDLMQIIHVLRALQVLILNR